MDIRKFHALALTFARSQQLIYARIEHMEFMNAHKLTRAHKFMLASTNEYTHVYTGMSLRVPRQINIRMDICIYIYPRSCIISKRLLLCHGVGLFSPLHFLFEDYMRLNVSSCVRLRARAHRWPYVKFMHARINIRRRFDKSVSACVCVYLHIYISLGSCVKFTRLRSYHGLAIFVLLHLFKITRVSMFQRAYICTRACPMDM